MPNFDKGKVFTQVFLPSRPALVRPRLASPSLARLASLAVACSRRKREAATREPYTTTRKVVATSVNVSCFSLPPWPVVSQACRG